jgi:3-phenylpropionate/cinnamic acid dioxygenase small subunit
MTNVPDHVAITNLLYRYAELIDAGDYEGIGAHLGDAIVTADATDEEIRGPEAITAMYHASTRKYENGTPLTKHVITNPIIEIADDGTTATCRSYYTVFQKTIDAPLQPIIAGYYRDEFAKTDGVWHFTRRHMGVDLIGDLSRHLLFSLGPDS